MIVLHYKSGPINMIWLLLSVSDLSIIMIGPGGLLLVVPIYLQFQFQFYWWVAKKKKTKLGCEKYFCGVTYWAPLAMLLACQGELVGKAIESNISFHRSILPYSWGNHIAWALRLHPLAMLSWHIQIMPSSAIVKVWAWFWKIQCWNYIFKGSCGMTNCFWKIS
jgi:hypothetical protein